MSKEFLSIVVTAHNEGLLLHKTMLSLFKALERVENIAYEIIVHIDNGDKTTLEYVKRYRSQKNIKIFQNSFGDTGPSRNFAVNQAKGNIVAFLDGDDLVSENWLEQSLEVLRHAKNDIIVHPEAILTFGLNQKNVLSLQKDSDDYQDLVSMLVGENCWCSTLVMKKETALKYPYRKVSKGYSHEDYIFNIDTLENGIKHKVAPSTVLFYRRAETSRLSSSNNENKIIPYNSFFDFQKFQQASASSAKIAKLSLRERGYILYKKIRNNSFLNFFITPVAKITIKLTKYRSRNIRIPDFVIEEWIKINQIETQLYPYKKQIATVERYSPEQLAGIGKAYIKIAQNIKHQTINYIFIVPWVICGGADKVLFNYIKALKEVHPEWNFVVITTLPSQNVWAKELPNYVDFIDFGNISFSLVPSHQDILFSRIITQLKCTNIHIINSEFGYRWAMHHEALIEENYNLNTSLFCGEYIPESNLRGVFSYDDPFLSSIFPIVDKVFTDNKTIIQKTIDKNGFDIEKFRVHYQPVPDLKITEYKSKSHDDGRIHILWAGRITNTKLPNIVAQIGAKLDPKKYVIDMYGVMSPEINKNIFSNSSAICYHGAFSGFNSLPIEDADYLLYTSLDDGIPNIILEATAAGLPIIASDDGGVNELIQDGKTGILVKNILDVNQYINAIERISKATSEECASYVKNAQDILKKRHSWKEFVKQVKEDF